MAGMFGVIPWIPAAPGRRDGTRRPRGSPGNPGSPGTAVAPVLGAPQEPHDPRRRVREAPGPAGRDNRSPSRRRLTEPPVVALVIPGPCALPAPGRPFPGRRELPAIVSSPPPGPFGAPAVDGGRRGAQDRRRPRGFLRPQHSATRLALRAPGPSGLGLELPPGGPGRIASRRINSPPSAPEPPGIRGPRVPGSILPCRASSPASPHLAGRYPATGRGPHGRLGTRGSHLIPRRRGPPEIPGDRAPNALPSARGRARAWCRPCECPRSLEAEGRRDPAAAPPSASRRRCGLGGLHGAGTARRQGSIPGRCGAAGTRIPVGVPAVPGGAKEPRVRPVQPLGTTKYRSCGAPVADGLPRRRLGARGSNPRFPHQRAARPSSRDQERALQLQEGIFGAYVLPVIQAVHDRPR